MRMFSTDNTNDIEQQEEMKQTEKKGKFFSFIKKAEEVDKKVVQEETGASPD